MRILSRFTRLCTSLLIMFSIAAHADEASDNAAEISSARWNLTLSPFTQHYHPKPEHRYVWLTGIERVDKDNSLMGVAYFSNSFGQDCVYIYPWGQTYPHLLGYEKLTGKWSAGLIYGYVKPYEDKVPLNSNGYSVGFVPALSWALGSGYEAQVSFPGGAGLMFHLQVPLNPGSK
jgi:hypothetical protein